MDGREDCSFLVDEGGKLEKSYEWSAAATFYENAIIAAIDRKNHGKAAEVYQRKGFCYYRAAMQARDLKDFKNYAHLACDAYFKAAKLFAKTQSPDKRARIAHCEAMATNINSLTKPNPAFRKESLEKCEALEREALKVYRELNDHFNLGKTYVEVNSCLFDRLHFEWDKESRWEIFREALNFGDKAIDIFSRLGEKHALARAYYTTSAFYEIAAKVSKLEYKSEYEQTALSYSRKAVELSQEVGDLFLLGMSSIWLGTTLVDFADQTESAAKYFKNALEWGRQIRDRYLIGRAAYLLAHLMAWNMVAEEVPEKIREISEKCEKYSKYAILNFRSISNDQEVASSYYWLAENFTHLAKSTETSMKKKRTLLEKSIKAGMKGLKHARRSGSIDATWFILHPLSKSLFLLSTMEKDVDKKKRLLRKSLKFRKENIENFEQAMPHYFWNHGVYHNYLALIQAELAENARNKSQKVRLLESSLENAEGCIRLCLKHGALNREKCAILGRYYTDLGRILNRIYSISGSHKLLPKLLEVLQGAVETYEQSDLPSRVAESYWQLAEVHNKLRNHSESSECFKSAHDSYVIAADKIPSLKAFYSDHASYMNGWSEIEKARHYHARQEYGQAEKHYQEAAKLHGSSKSWEYLVPNYLAWAQLERAEDLSRREKIEESRDHFKKAAKMFAEAKKSIKARMKSIEITEEKEMATELTKASDIRREYCLGRLTLEEAKSFDRKGDALEGVRRYGFAAKKFQVIINAMKYESNRKELKPIVYLCKAWQMMTRAEAEASPDLYLEASKFFDQAKDHSVDERARLLALGHSCFCKALEAGRTFEATRETKLHTSATQHLEGAANFYVRAGFESGSDYAKATQRLFDAHMYMHKAKTEMNPVDKAQYYRISEKLLEASAVSFTRAKNPEKASDVRKFLETVREERELALSLTKIMQVPPIVSTTASFATPSPTHEKAVGRERFERANLQTYLTLDVKDVRAGEDFNVKMQIANVGKEAVQLSKIENMLPENVEIVSKPDSYHFERSCLSLKGKRIDALNTEEINLVMRSFDKGSLEINPIIIYVDEAGHQMTATPNPAAVDVLKVILPNRVSTGYNELDDLLFGGLPRNYSVILTSPSCDEKDLMVRRFLEAGLSDQQVTFLVSIKASRGQQLTETYQSNFFIFICNPQAEGVIKGLPNVFKLKGVENLTEINIALTSAFRRLDESPGQSKRVCIEIISDVLLQHHAVITRKWLTGLIPDFVSKGFTVLGVINPQMHPPQEAQAILDLFEGEISIHEKRTEKGLGKFLKIKKMHGQKYLESELLLKKKKLES